jgi:hypothetical protein
MIAACVGARIAIGANELGDFIFEDVNKGRANGQPNLILDKGLKGGPRRLTVEHGLGILRMGSHGVPPMLSVWLPQV